MFLDAVVAGKRKVKTTMSSNGGLIYDVNKSYLSDLGTSTDLWNFLPGVQADNDGNISLIGVSGNVEIYIDNVKIEDYNRLLSYKSEDFKSVEVIRNPGARYKNADAVINIKTVKRLNGFSSHLSLSSSLAENRQFFCDRKSN